MEIKLFSSCFEEILTHKQSRRVFLFSHILFLATATNYFFGFFFFFFSVVLCFVQMSFQCRSLEKESESQRGASLASGCLANGRLSFPAEKLLFTDRFESGSSFTK